MLAFMRNKLVSIARKDQDALQVHGILDDDIYGLEIDVSIRLRDLTILSLDGKWNHWTTPECPRAIRFLRGAVGLTINEEEFSQRVHKVVGRKACRHFANLLLECCDAARDAALLARWEEAKTRNPGLSFETFLDQGEAKPEPAFFPSPAPPSDLGTGEAGAFKERKAHMPEGVVIDLHVHTSQASPCSSAPVDELIEEAKRIGLDGICLTDHNHVWGPESLEELRRRHDFLILRGNEITTDQGDMLVFGFDEDIKGIIKLEDLAEAVHASEGCIIAAHPFRGFLTFGPGQLGLTAEKAGKRALFNWVDGVEVLNGKVTDEENRFASAVATRLGLSVTGGSDAHEVAEVGIYATRCPGPVRDERDLISALRGGACTPMAFRKAGGPEEKK